MVWTKLAAPGGVRRARSFLLLAGPRVGRRASNFLAKILELWPCDAVTDATPSRDAASGGTTPSHVASTRRPAASALRVRADFVFVSKYQRHVSATSSKRAPACDFPGPIPRPDRPLRSAPSLSRSPPRACRRTAAAFRPDRHRLRRIGGGRNARPCPAEAEDLRRCLLTNKKLRMPLFSALFLLARDFVTSPKPSGCTSTRPRE